MVAMTDTAVELDADRAGRSTFASRPDVVEYARAAGVPVLDVVVPVYNEQAALAASVHRLHRHLRDHFPFPARITIADNASVDATPEIAAQLAADLPDVRFVRLEEKAAAAPCTRCGPNPTPRCWPTWTLTCPPIWPPSHRWSPR